MGTGSEGQPRRSCQLPIALEFRRHVKKEVGEEEGNGRGCSPEEKRAGSFVLRLLSLSYRWEP